MILFMISLENFTHIETLPQKGCKLSHMLSANGHCALSQNHNLIGLLESPVCFFGCNHRGSVTCSVIMIYVCYSLIRATILQYWTRTFYQLSLNCKFKNSQKYTQKLKVDHSSHFLYQGFAVNYFFRYLLTQQCLKQKRKLGVSVHFNEQCNEVDLFALKSDFCLICLILIHILLYFTFSDIMRVPTKCIELVFFIRK